MVKEGSSITAHTWNASEGRWDKIGDVVGGSGGSQQASGKQLYQGKVVFINSMTIYSITVVYHEPCPVKVNLHVVCVKFWMWLMY